MTTRQLWTPYDNDLREALEHEYRYGTSIHAALVRELARGRGRVEGYRRGVADTEAKYEELVAAARILLECRWVKETSSLEKDNLEAALVELKGAEHDNLP